MIYICRSLTFINIYNNVVLEQRRIEYMYCVRNITEDLYYVGGDDRRLNLFENIHPIEKGVSYNSYLLLDEKQYYLIQLIGQFVVNFLIILKVFWEIKL